MPQRPLQTFDEYVDRAALPARLSALRAHLKAQDLDGFLVPRSDEHQNEYVPPGDERLAFLSGFTGSAGLALICDDKAVLFVDGRYVTQAPREVDNTAWAVVLTTQTTPEIWMAAQLRAGARIGYDPWLHTHASALRLAKACADAGATLIAHTPNPIDAIWRERPEKPSAPITIHPLALAGEDAASKLAKLADAMGAAGADALVVSDPHALAWLFNIRGGDVAHTPLPLGYALLHKDRKAQLFVAEAKLSPAVRAYLQDFGDIHAPEDFQTSLAAESAGKRVMLDAATAADAIHSLIVSARGEPLVGADPAARLKAIKTDAEISGTRAAHLRDGAALTRCLSWIANQTAAATITEIDVVEMLEQMRRDTGALEDVSFPTIAGSGPNGAIVHYRVTRATNRALRHGELLLLDSGAQYQDGTTDVTRTIAIGAPSAEMRDRFTRVLKGHIAIARSVFPKGTTGAQIDSFARQFLWQAGVDFDHGTGHGVGSYLSVHEGPARISKLGNVALETGMILSNEPGYYKPDAYGIRIENLVLVRDVSIEGAEKPMLGFETLTLAPIDRALIDTHLLSIEERQWIDAYHARVRASLSPLLGTDDQVWLAAATQALDR